MPKLKTHKGTAKRIKVTGSGKLVRERAFGNQAGMYATCATFVFLALINTYGI